MVHLLEKRVLNDFWEFGFIDILVISDALTVVDVFLAKRGIENGSINKVNEPDCDFLTKHHAMNLINSKLVTFYDEFSLFLNYVLHQVD